MRYFADPFVMKTGEGYYAYGTDGPDRPTYSQTGLEFPILFSRDLKSWELKGGALKTPLDHPGFWAPEVAYANGTYTMFYSSGGHEGQGHQVKFAHAITPVGPFEGDDEPLIPSEPFSIDAHPFQDPKDGKWYLFFAKDFFDDPVGTGIAVVPLNDKLGTDGEIVQMFRAQHDWQIFERDRKWYGRLWPTWYCVEGPFVVFRQNRYWMFYSGGNWHANDYGVGCAVADQVLGPYQELTLFPSILRTNHDLFGPGHNSIIAGPDGEDRICFHAWDSDYSARQLRIEKLIWRQEGPKVDFQ